MRAAVTDSDLTVEEDPAGDVVLVDSEAYCSQSVYNHRDACRLVERVEQLPAGSPMPDSLFHSLEQNLRFPGAAMLFRGAGLQDALISRFQNFEGLIKPETFPDSAKADLFSSAGQESTAQPSALVSNTLDEDSSCTSYTGEYKSASSFARASHQLIEDLRRDGKILAALLRTGMSLTCVKACLQNAATSHWPSIWCYPLQIACNSIIPPGCIDFMSSSTEGISALSYNTPIPPLTVRAFSVMIFLRRCAPPRVTSHSPLFPSELFFLRGEDGAGFALGFSPEHELVLTSLVKGRPPTSVTWSATKFPMFEWMSVAVSIEQTASAAGTAVAFKDGKSLGSQRCRWSPARTKLQDRSFALSFQGQIGEICMWTAPLQESYLRSVCHDGKDAKFDLLELGRKSSHFPLALWSPCAVKENRILANCMVAAHSGLGLEGSLPVNNVTVFTEPVESALWTLGGPAMLGILGKKLSSAVDISGIPEQFTVASASLLRMACACQDWARRRRTDTVSISDMLILPANMQSLCPDLLIATTDAMDILKQGPLSEGIVHVVLLNFQLWESTPNSIQMVLGHLAAVSSADTCVGEVLRSIKHGGLLSALCNRMSYWCELFKTEPREVLGICKAFCRCFKSVMKNTAQTASPKETLALLSLLTSASVRSSGIVAHILNLIHTLLLDTELQPGQIRNHRVPGNTSALASRFLECQGQVTIASLLADENPSVRSAALSVTGGIIALTWSPSMPAWQADLLQYCAFLAETVSPFSIKDVAMCFEILHAEFPFFPVETVDPDHESSDEPHSSHSSTVLASNRGLVSPKNPLASPPRPILVPKALPLLFACIKSASPASRLHSHIRLAALAGDRSSMSSIMQTDVAWQSLFCKETANLVSLCTSDAAADEGSKASLDSETMSQALDCIITSLARIGSDLLTQNGGWDSMMKLIKSASLCGTRDVSRLLTRTLLQRLCGEFSSRLQEMEQHSIEKAQHLWKHATRLAAVILSIEQLFKDGVLAENTAMEVNPEQISGSLAPESIQWTSIDDIELLESWCHGVGMLLTIASRSSTGWNLLMKDWWLSTSQSSGTSAAAPHLSPPTAPSRFSSMAESLMGSVKGLIAYASGDSNPLQSLWGCMFVISSFICARRSGDATTTTPNSLHHLAGDIADIAPFQTNNSVNNGWYRTKLLVECISPPNSGSSLSSSLLRGSSQSPKVNTRVVLAAIAICLSAMDIVDSFPFYSMSAESSNLNDAHRSTCNNSRGQGSDASVVSLIDDPETTCTKIAASGLIDILAMLLSNHGSSIEKLANTPGLLGRSIGLSAALTKVQDQANSGINDIARLRLDLAASTIEVPWLNLFKSTAVGTQVLNQCQALLGFLARWMDKFSAPNMTAVSTDIVHAMKSTAVNNAANHAKKQKYWSLAQEKERLRLVESIRSKEFQASLKHKNGTGVLSHLWAKNPLDELSVADHPKHCFIGPCVAIGDRTTISLDPSEQPLTRIRLIMRSDPDIVKASAIPCSNADHSDESDQEGGDLSPKSLGQTLELAQSLRLTSIDPSKSVPEAAGPQASSGRKGSANNAHGVLDADWYSVGIEGSDELVHDDASEMNVSMEREEEDSDSDLSDGEVNSSKSSMGTVLQHPPRKKKSKLRGPTIVSDELAEFVTPMHSIRGRFVQSDKAVAFLSPVSVVSHAKHLSIGAMERCSKLVISISEGEVVHFCIPLAAIIKTYHRRILLQPVGIEIVCAGYSCLVSFRLSTLSLPRGVVPSGDNVSSIKISMERLQRVIRAMEKSIGRAKLAFVFLGRQSFSASQWLLSQWQSREISNFDYLMALNSLAGRTHNDLAQYPVLPWVLQDYSSDTIDLRNPSVFRDLSKPMGALNSENLTRVKDRFLEYEDTEGGTPKFHYGSHYSSVGSVLLFLLRVHPYTDHAKELQGGHFDHADRLFTSVEKTFKNATTSMSDVKELVPEFFFLPQLFINHNKLKLGRKQNGEVVDDVTLPPWCNHDPVTFVRTQKAALESDYVSASIHHWIDLIFGYKQRGPDSIEAHNVFYYLTYEGSVNFDALPDYQTLKAVETQIANFGQTPVQLLSSPHPPRRAVATLAPPISGGGRSQGVGSATRGFRFVNFKEDEFKCVFASQMSSPSSGSIESSQGPSLQLLSLNSRAANACWGSGKGAVCMLASKPDCIVMLTSGGDLSTVRWRAGRGPVRTKSVDRPLRKGLGMEINRACLCGPQNETLVTSLGWDGGLTARAIDGDSHRIVTIFPHSTATTAVCSSEDGVLLCTGSAGGEVALHRYTGISSLSSVCQWIGHSSPVCSLNIHTTLGFVASGGYDGRVCVWDYREDRLILHAYISSSSIIKAVQIVATPEVAVAVLTTEPDDIDLDHCLGTGNRMQNQKAGMSAPSMLWLVGLDGTTKAKQPVQEKVESVLYVPNPEFKHDGIFIVLGNGQLEIYDSDLRKELTGGSVSLKRVTERGCGYITAATVQDQHLIIGDSEGSLFVFQIMKIKE